MSRAEPVESTHSRPRAAAPPAFAAVDIGAESGRVALGRFDGRRLRLDVVHRFPNRPVQLPDGLHWNLPGVLAALLDGLGRAAEETPLEGVGVDAWGVDYALLDRRGALLGLPFHYRDPRTAGVVDRAHARVSRAELHATTGIQTMQINTVFQLLAEEGSAALAAAERIALVPDLLSLWLSGALANEITVASTTGLVDARRGTWARRLIARLGLPSQPFEAELVEPGTLLGPVIDRHAPCAGVPVRTVASHDTASAFAATPAGPGDNAAILSSGTWSLLGVEEQAPALSADALAFNLTNERGVDGTVRVLRNVMGLWLLQECLLAWELPPGDAVYAQIGALAAAAPPGGALFDPDDDAFLAPGDMPARIADACRSSGQTPPGSRGELARSIFESLACKYRLVLEGLSRVTGRELDCVHVIGGGGRNELLCQLVADVTGLPVHAGPIEATALGNVLVQARAVGLVGSLAEGRELVAASMAPRTFEPDEPDDLYDRFLAVTGLANSAPQGALATNKESW